MSMTSSERQLRQKIGQLFFIGVSGPELDVQTRELLTDVMPGGICLFARNIKTASQTRKLLDDIADLLGYRPIFSIDQEGGTVDRLRRIVTPLAAAAEIKTPEKAAEMAALVAETIRILGFNMDFAPVVDVVTNERAGRANGLYTRPFGRNKEEVVELAGAFLLGLRSHGIAGCLKHFPGLGLASVDSHEELPTIDIDEEEFNSVDLYPYRELLRFKPSSVMIAHASFPGLSLQETDQNGKLLPSSLSYRFVTELLKTTLGFDGVAVTDDLEMGAIVRNYGIGAACRMALSAGNDMLAICADPVRIREGFDAVFDAVEADAALSANIDRSIERIEHLKASVAEPVPFDQDRIGELSLKIAEFNSSLKN